MTTWNEAETAAPEIATLARARIEATGLAFVATIRSDGFPRISGVEPWFAGGELYLGMMPGSLKARDLLRDPRLSLHNASIDKEVTEGDAKVTGRAVEVLASEPKELLRAEVRARTGHDVGTEFHLFAVDVIEIATVRPGGDHLVIDSWRAGGSPRRVERR